jgi:hypothetical protein
LQDRCRVPDDARKSFTSRARPVLAASRPQQQQPFVPEQHPLETPNAIAFLYG